MKVRAENLPWYSGIAIAIYQPREGEKTGAVKGLVFELLEDTEPVPTAFTLKKSEAQLLMDDLWHCGLRPSDGTGSAGQLAATQKHLEDMRKIAFKKLGMDDQK